MAGSFDHCVTENGNYRGTALLENMGDMKEAIDEMMFMLLFTSRHKWAEGEMILDEAKRELLKCLRGERQWPEWFTVERVKDY